MHLPCLPENTKELLEFLRSLQMSDPQDLISVYTTSLNLLKDDIDSLFIFLDYINLYSKFCEMDEIEYLFSLFKVKMRKFKLFWKSYLKFQVVERKKDFEVSFKKMLEYLRFKAFEGKDEILDELIKSKDILKDSLCSSKKSKKFTVLDKEGQITINNAVINPNDVPVVNTTVKSDDVLLDDTVIKSNNVLLDNYLQSNDVLLDNSLQSNAVSNVPNAVSNVSNAVSNVSNAMVSDNFLQSKISPEKSKNQSNLQGKNDTTPSYPPGHENSSDLSSFDATSTNPISDNTFPIGQCNVPTPMSTATAEILLNKGTDSSVSAKYSPATSPENILRPSVQPPNKVTESNMKSHDNFQMAYSNRDSYTSNRADSYTSNRADSYTSNKTSSAYNKTSSAYNRASSAYTSTPYLENKIHYDTSNIPPSINRTPERVPPLNYSLNNSNSSELSIDKKVDFIFESTSSQMNVMEESKRIEATNVGYQFPDGQATNVGYQFPDGQATNRGYQCTDGQATKSNTQNINYQDEILKYPHVTDKSHNQMNLINNPSNSAINNGSHNKNSISDQGHLNENYHINNTAIPKDQNTVTIPKDKNTMTINKENITMNTHSITGDQNVVSPYNFFNSLLNNQSQQSQEIPVNTPRMDPNTYDFFNTQGSQNIEDTRNYSKLEGDVETAFYKDKASLISDKASLVKDKSSLISDKSSLISDKASLVNVNVAPSLVSVNVAPSLVKDKASLKTTSALQDDNPISSLKTTSVFEIDCNRANDSIKLRFSPQRKTPYRPENSKVENKRRFVDILAPFDNENAFVCDPIENTMTFGQGLGQRIIHFKDKDLLIVNKIGKGGYSNVFKVMLNNEIYALKQIRVEDQESLNICMDEIGLLEKLNGCDYVIKMIDFEIKNDFVNILLEFGEIDLSNLIKSENLNIFYIKFLWQSILKILVFIHGKRIVHRDIKPANFVLVKGKLKIIDFGISKSIKGDTTSILNIEKAGTLNYISPEQCGGRKVSRAADVWAAGCILYYMIYRKNIHSVKNVMDVLRLMSEEAEIKYGTTADERAIDSIKACLVYDPKKRAKPEDLLKFGFLE